MNVVLAGGGTAGHVEPALALADALRRSAPADSISLVGTARGLETRLVPARGYPLDLIPPVPLPRRLTPALLRVPGDLRGSVRAARAVLDERDADVVVGFGGYVALPVYLAARRRRTPVVVHEANARAGLANRVGARFAHTVATSYADTKLRRAQLVGIPLRGEIASLDRVASRGEGRRAMGLDPTRPTLLVTGGSQGARRINQAVLGVAGELDAAGLQVLHATGVGNYDDVTAALARVALPGDAAPYVALPYVERMDLAYAAADLVLCRSGAMTVAEVSAVGLPAVFVPLPHGNGEQRRNAAHVVASGGALEIEDAALDADALRRRAQPGSPTPPSASPSWSGPQPRADGEPAVSELPWTRVHLVGIGGAGMSGIARILLARGAAVSGSDAKDSRALAALLALGATIHVGHAAEHIGDAEVVVTSTAIRATNPEVVAARERGVAVLPRAAALAALMSGRRAVAVAGTHGKTTTTSMLTVVLQRSGADPSFAIGGDLNEPGSNAHHGTGDVFVAEADESDGSFLLYSPAYAVVTNVDADHLDHYGSFEAVQQSFRDFVARIEPGGFLALCADDAGSLALAGVARERGRRVLTYGESAEADLRVDPLTLAGAGSTFGVVLRGVRLGDINLAVPGRAYALDAAGALAVALELGVPFATAATALVAFKGARRRFELRGEARGVRVYDSYAHHPTELAADLAAAREVVGDGRLLVAFQPHLYSRTQAFAADFGRALGLADEVVVMEVYAAREDPVPGVTGRLVAAEVPLPADRVAYEPSWSAVPAHLASRARPGDLVLTLGAGDVTLLGPEVLLALQGDAA